MENFCQPLTFDESGKEGLIGMGAHLRVCLNGEVLISEGGLKERVAKLQEHI